MTLWRNMALAGALACAGPALANDSTAVLEAGGLRLVRDAPVELLREDLKIAADRIEVAYTFRAADSMGLSTLVAFPLPVYDLAWLGMWGMGGDGATIGGQSEFQLWVDGQPKQAFLDVATLRNGINVTEALTELGIPVDSLDSMQISEAIRSLPQPRIDQLIQADLIEQFSDTEFAPKWTVQASFYWLQQFPPGRDVSIRHVYRPVAGMFFVADPGLRDFDPQAFCMSDAERRGVQNRIAQSQQGAVLGTEVHYVLSTGAHWWGPIRDFSLTIDKGAAENMVSLCFDGLQKIAPTQFRAQLRDYTPDQDLKVLFISQFD